MSNYPAGVSDNHPYFNEPREIATGVECGADEALVVPSFAVKAALYEITDLLERLPTATAAYAPSPAAARKAALNVVKRLQAEIDKWEQEREYECPFHDDIDLPESECAQWVCPTCGNDRETDTMPEDVDPDRAYEEMRDARYDD
ncbi:hypothetical protein SEA_PUREGLOBE5_62 [Arthrobacter phage Pureglobe5]|nr:hypothetical protein SEA_PUREGLOBE5_62 [Arthrobacter phage Pureglobe5]